MIFQKVLRVLAWILSVLLLVTGVLGYSIAGYAAFCVAGMGLLFLPPVGDMLEERFKKRFLVVRGVLIIILLMVFGQNYTPSEGQLNSDQQAMLEEFFEEIEAQQSEFEQMYGGESPEVVLNAKYDEIVSEEGESTSDRINEFSAFFASELGLDEAKMSYVQHWEGTYGIQGLIQTMDSEADGVASSLEIIEHYHQVRSYDEADFAGLSAEEIFDVFVDAYIAIYGEDVESNNFKDNKATQILELTGFDWDRARILVEHHLTTNRIFELFPEDFENKEALMNL